MESITTPDGIDVRPGSDNGLYIEIDGEFTFIDGGSLRRIHEADGGERVRI
jgi:hypothetical protein